MEKETYNGLSNLYCGHMTSTMMGISLIQKPAILALRGHFFLGVYSKQGLFAAVADSPPKRRGTEDEGAPQRADMRVKRLSAPR